MKEKIRPPRAYAMIDSLRVAFDVGALGLGAAEQIDRKSSLATAITVEGVCSALTFLVFIHECVDFITGCRNRRQRENHSAREAKDATMGQSIYLFFRLISIFASLTGMALLANNLGNEKDDIKTTVGMVLVSVGIFTSRALSGTKQKTDEEEANQYSRLESPRVEV